MINWTSGEVYATGIGAPPPNAVNPAQARAMAERAAQVVAYRNLLEIVKGVRVDSETVVENFMTKSDIIRTKVDGIIKGAMPVKKQYLSDGTVEITVVMRMWQIRLRSDRALIRHYKRAGRVGLPGFTEEAPGIPVGHRRQGSEIPEVGAFALAGRRRFSLQIKDIRSDYRTARL